MAKDSEMGDYPVDLWPEMDVTTLSSASQDYLSRLEPSSPQENMSAPSKVEGTGSDISRLQLLGDDQSDFSLLVKHPPGCPTKVEALYLQDKWWAVDDVLRSSRKDRTGLVEVQSVMEWLVLVLLQQVVEEQPGEQPLFSIPPLTEHAKLLWVDGEAVGFYTFKKKGSLCDGCTSQSYLLPVLDTILVRRSRRRHGFGLWMLEDFSQSFPNDEVLGISHPLSPSMVAVCRKYLEQQKEQQERLYEVEAPGGWAQRRNISLNIKLGRYAHSLDELLCSTLERKSEDEDEPLHKKQLCDSGPPHASLENSENTEALDKSEGQADPSSRTDPLTSDTSSPRPKHQTSGVHRSKMSKRTKRSLD